jgi:hypothetical protein
MSMLGILVFTSSTISKNVSNLFFQQVKGINSAELHEHAFAQFNHDFKMAARGKKLTWSLYFRILTADNVWVNLVGIDENGGRNAGAFARFFRPREASPINSVSFQDDESNEITGHGIFPDALLKDYNQDGEVDAADETIKQACMADFSTCIPPECISSGARFKLSDAGCVQRSVIPFFEINQNQDVIYFSLRPRRRLNSTSDFVYQSPITKAIYLYPNQEA